MTGRCCAECREEFGPLRPAVEPVELRTLEAGRLVPRLKIVAHGALCAGCARQGARAGSKPRRAS